MAALFPGSQTLGRTEVGWIERIALSVGVSIAVVPLLGLVLNFTPWGIRFRSIVATIALFTAGVGYAAYWRRMRLPPDSRLSLTLDLDFPEWREYTAVDKGVTTILAVSVVVAGGTLVYVLVTPRSGERFTDFYVLGPGGNASGYPRALNVSQAASVVLGLTNHESASANYTVRINLVGVRIVYNATTRTNETAEINRTTWAWINVTIANGANWTYTYAFSISYVGLWKIQFLLFKDGNFFSPYRKLQFYTTVT